jgi:hypothetical protein
MIEALSKEILIQVRSTTAEIKQAHWSCRVCLDDFEHNSISSLGVRFVGPVYTFVCIAIFFEA